MIFSDLNFLPAALKCLGVVMGLGLAALALATLVRVSCRLSEKRKRKHSKKLNELAENKRLHSLYIELLYAVARKHEGETRHETALRYIRERENRTEGPHADAKNDKDSPSSP